MDDRVEFRVYRKGYGSESVFAHHLIFGHSHVSFVDEDDVIVVAFLSTDVNSISRIKN